MNEKVIPNLSLNYRTRGWEDEPYALNEESSVRVGTDKTTSTLWRTPSR